MAEPAPRRRLSHRALLAACVVGVCAMVGAAYAAVPLYRAFCAATGFAGTPRRAQNGPAPGAVGRPLTVRFDTNVRGLPWTFEAEETTQAIRIGVPQQTFFRVTNTGTAPLTGRAVYSLVPEAAGGYFVKTQCFCFDDQTIAPGKTVEFPVIYYVDPKFASDPSTRAFTDVTLSYTFYPSKKAAPRA